MSCDSTDQRWAHHYAQAGREKLERQSEECLCDCAVVESLKSRHRHTEGGSSKQASNIIKIKPKP